MEEELSGYTRCSSLVSRISLIESDKASGSFNRFLDFARDDGFGLLGVSWVNVQEC